MDNDSSDCYTGCPGYQYVFLSENRVFTFTTSGTYGVQVIPDLSSGSITGSYYLHVWRPNGAYCGTPSPTATATPTPFQTPDFVAVSLHDMYAYPDQVVTVPMTVTDLSGWNINSYQFQITFNPNDATAETVDATGTLSDGMTIVQNTDYPGHLIVSATSDFNLTGQGTLIYVRFRMHTSYGTSLTFEDYTDPGNVVHPAFRFNNGVPRATTTGAFIRIIVFETHTTTPTATATVAVTPTPILTLTFDVNSTADVQDAVPGDHICADTNGMCTLRAAITESNAVQFSITTINLPAGVYTTTLTGGPEDANASGDLDISSHVTIHGAGSALTIIQAAETPNTATERVIHCLTSAVVEVDGVTVRNGRELFSGSGTVGGGGIFFVGAHGPVVLDDVVITNNVSQGRGGGIGVRDDGGVRLTINNSVISNNRSGSDVAGSSAFGGGIDIDGGAYFGYSFIEINNTTMTANMADSSVANAYGGAMNLSADYTQLRLNGCVISDNQATATGSGNGGYAGGINVTGSHMDIVSSRLDGNSALTVGGGLRVASVGTTLNGEVGLERSTISNNTAGSGGGVAILNGEIVAGTTTISGNSATAEFGHGGGIYSAGSFVTYIDIGTSTVSGNRRMGRRWAI